MYISRKSLFRLMAVAIYVCVCVSISLSVKKKQSTFEFGESEFRKTIQQNVRKLKQLKVFENARDLNKATKRRKRQR